MSKTAKPLEPKNLTLNEKIIDLDQSIEWFYGEDFSLDLATDKYRSAIEKAKHIEADLKELQNEVELLSEDFSVER